MPHSRIVRSSPWFNFRIKSPLSALVLGALGLLSVAPPAQAQYTFSTFAGTAGRPGSQDGTGGGAESTLFSNPTGIAVAADGTIYVADSDNAVIRKITSAGVVSTFVGTPGKAGVNNGTTADPAVTFDGPLGAVLDSSGNLYVTDYLGATVRKITPSGTVTTLAGTALTSGLANGTGTDTKFNHPAGIAIDSVGNLFVADSGNNVIRKITPAGVVTTAAGTDTAGLNNPRGIAVDGSGNIYVADTGNNRISKFTPAGVATVVAGKADTYGTTDGTGENARFSFPNSLAIDANGNLFVVDTVNSSIRKVTPGGTVSTVAGQSGTAGRVDGAATTVARFERPGAVAVDGSGNLYVTDSGNQLIRKVTSAGNVVTISGTGGQTGLLNGSGYALSPSGFRNPTNVAVDGSGNLYVSDTGNHTIRKITPAGSTAVLAGLSGIFGLADGSGGAARFNSPAGVALDGAGNLFVADSANHTIRRISPSGDVITYAGTAGTSGSADGDRAAATFRYPSGVAVDGAGNVYVADYGNHAIRMIATSGVVTTLAGTAGVEGKGDGTGSAATFSYPRDVAVDASGNVYVADTGNDVIRRISPGGLVTTLAGSAGNTGAADGSGGAARFSGPSGVSVDSAGNIYVADTGNSTLRLITSGGVVSTIGGTAGNVGTLDGVGTAALFNFPTDIAIDSSGNAYVVDNRNHTIRKGTLPGSGSGGTGSGGTGSGGTGSGSGSGGTGSSGGSSASDGAFSGGTVGTGFLTHPIGLIADTTGTFYVCDTAGHCIRTISSKGVVTTLAGTAGSSGTADGTGSAARFNNPTGIVRDSTTGNFYVTDAGNATIRMVTSAGVVTTLAGSAGATGSTDGVGSAARFNSPKGIALLVNSGSSAVELYVTDSVNNTIRKILAADGTVTTLAGIAGAPGDADGAGPAARFNNPTGIAVDLSGALVVADTYNSTIRSIRTTDLLGTNADGVTVVTQPAGTTYTIAGSAGISGAYDGTAGNALFNLPQGVSVSTTSGAIFVADTGNSVIRLINTSRKVSTVSGIAGITGNRSGGGEQALFNQPQGIFSYSANSVVIADTGNSILRSVVFPSSSTTGTPAVTTVSLASATTSGGSDSGSGSSSGGGGGAPSIWFVATIGALGAARILRRKPAHG